MKYHTSISLFAISLVLFLIEQFSGVDIVVAIYNLHNSTFDKLIPLFVITTAGLVFDYVKYLLRKKDLEKELVYHETMIGVNHLVRNLQNKFMIINASESIKKEFGEDIIDILNQSSLEVELILEKLSQLEEITPNRIKNISFSNVQ